MCSLFSCCFLILIGRAKHKGSWIPGKVAPHRKKMYYPLDGKEHSTSIYEILVTDTPSVIQWIAASGGKAGNPYARLRIRHAISVYLDVMRKRTHIRI